ncbi:hypothetical protein BC835DRAFT_1366775 [Cytidiella melzeri]|nr:hypothetical protein BC835DRAFT_1366775 [Cytidiella melzeri]
MSLLKSSIGDTASIQSTTGTLASLKTSSTLTAHSLDSYEQLSGPQAGAQFESKAVSKHRTSNSLVEPGVDDGLAPQLLHHFRSQGPERQISKLVQMVLASDLVGVQSCALEAVFAFTQDGSSCQGSVINALAKLPEVELFTVLRRLVEFQSTLSDRSQLWQNAKWTTETRQNFLTGLLHRRWDTLNFNSAQNICNILEVEQSVFKFLFPTPDQDRRKPAQYTHLIFTYLTSPSATQVMWPSLVFIEESHFLQLPLQWPVTHIVRVLPEHGSPTMTAIVEHILRATRPNVQFDPTHSELEELQRLLPSRKSTSTHYTTVDYLCRHPASPFLWFALYLAYENHLAARLLVEGGLVDNIRDLYELGFPDPRLAGKDLEDAALQSSYDLMRLCYMILRVLFRHTNASKAGVLHDVLSSGMQRTAYAQARERAESLKEFMRGDMRDYARMLSARYHDADTLYWDEVEAEVRDFQLLSGKAQQDS